MNDELEAKIEALRQKHGTVFVVELGEAMDNEVVVFRRPTRLEFRAFKTNRGDDAQRAIADEKLCQACVVLPDPAGLDTLFDRFGALPVVLCAEIQEAAGGVKLDVKKR